MNIDLNTILLPFLLTLFAGLTTIIGGLSVFVSGKGNKKLLSFGLGLAGGVMIYISLVSIYSQSVEMISESLSEQIASLWVIFAIGVGIVISAVIDKVIPHFFHLHTNEDTSIKELKNSNELYQSGIFTTFAIALHNIPEGLITFMAGVVDIRLGVSLAIAIALHNIPEGISVALPVYQATGSKSKAIGLTAIAGLAEPFGAILAILIFGSFVSSFWLGFSFAMVAGIMLYISFDEILPTAYRLDKGHLGLYGVLFGMFVVALSGVII
jgi:zinc transporter, ZIP family